MGRLSRKGPKYGMPSARTAHLGLKQNLKWAVGRFCHSLERVLEHSLRPGALSID
jgi:hypothetical protein